jgi:hypothetical protein
VSDYQNYNYQAASDAVDMAENFFTEIVLSFIDNHGGASDDFANDYEDGDSYHHETHVDKEYELLEAAQLLDQLEDHEETDSGLWEGLGPRKAVSCQAAFTYGNAVAYHWMQIIDTINEDEQLAGLFAEFEAIDPEEDAPKPPEQWELAKIAIETRIREIIKAYNQ